MTEVVLVFEEAIAAIVKKLALRVECVRDGTEAAAFHGTTRGWSRGAPRSIPQYETFVSNRKKFE